MTDDERDRSNIEAALEAGADVSVSLSIDARIIVLVDEMARAHKLKRSPMVEWILAEALLPEGQRNAVRKRGIKR